MTEWGIFNDESADWSAAEAVEADFYSETEAIIRLMELRKETGDSDDGLVVHEVEEANDDDSDDDDDEEPEPVAGSLWSLPVERTPTPGLYWLVLRPGDDVGLRGYVNVVPVTNRPHRTAVDVRGLGRWWVRCGWSEWVSVAAVRRLGRCLSDGGRWEEVAADCRRVLADLVRGRGLTLSSDLDADADDDSEQYLANETQTVAILYS